MFEGSTIKTVSFEDDVYPEELKLVRKRLISRNGFTDARGNGLPDFDHLMSADTPRSNVLAQVIEELNDEDNERRWKEDEEDEKVKAVQHRGLVGLAFSGGGIRSATYNLGVMQALKKMGLFRCVDYLSTVSGGGYIGSCISSTLASVERSPAAEQGSEDQNDKSPDANAESDESPDSDDPSDEVTKDLPAEPLNEIFGHEQGRLEPSVFRHLRDNANYLAPNGLRDVLRIPAILLRGIVVNFLVILPYLLAAALLTIWIKPTGASLNVSTLEDTVRAVFGDWWVQSLGNNFLVTKLLVVLLVLFFALYPGIHMLGQKWKLGTDSNWTLRNKFGRFLGLCIVVVAAVAFVELQPVAIKLVHEAKQQGWSKLEMFTTGTGVFGTLATLFADKLLPKLTKFYGKLAFYALGALGAAFFWLLYLYLCEQGIDWEGTRTPETRWDLPERLADYGIPAVILWIYTLWTVDVNFTGIHKFYRDRLSKAYIIGLKKPDTIVKPEGGHPADDSNDRIKLSDYSVVHSDKVKLSELNTQRGPYHLINTLLNLKKTEDRYKSGRRGDFFMFSKRFIGGDITGYCKTRDMEDASRHVDLATAMAISGAAAAPNMGKITVKPLIFILAMLNVRLNYWLPNPAKLRPKPEIMKNVRFFKDLPMGAISRVGPMYLLAEMFGMNTAKSKYINLSDGGHIENLGVYELVRRQCRLIIAGDGEADPELKFQGLAEVIRMIQIDMGIKIQVSGLDEIRRGEQHHAVGTIRYPNGRIGKLIYLKSSLLGDNNLKATLDKENYTTSPYRDDNMLFDDGAYIAHYKAQHPAFPHESTGDQFFDEGQFECYRALGYNVAMNTLQSWEQRPATPDPE
ncbi:patatin-like phospholipase family protein [Pelagibius sp. Alg239-R121]|uniref:patatin-like phospholipase family protein n=1 Tax=Pelagibius sp. Alg239-R121 TaxID=2993448 RepID=UPI0024A65470|nr:patatin-like phospholipase family protein [Pelagibius sp. Alg239-R121]